MIYLRAEGTKLIAEPKIGEVFASAVARTVEASIKTGQCVFMEWSSDLIPINGHELLDQSPEGRQQFVDTIVKLSTRDNDAEENSAPEDTEKKYSEDSVRLTEQLAQNLLDKEDKEQTLQFICTLSSTDTPSVKINPRILYMALKQKYGLFEDKELDIQGLKEDYIDFMLAQAADVMEKGWLLPNPVSLQCLSNLSQMKHETVYIFHPDAIISNSRQKSPSLDDPAP